MEYHLKKPNKQRWDLNLRRRFQSRALLSTRPSCFPKKEASSPHTENYHCNNNKVHFVGAILLHITNRCVTNTICFFK